MAFHPACNHLPVLINYGARFVVKAQPGKGPETLPPLTA